jgi:hypothetical protein
MKIEKRVTLDATELDDEDLAALAATATAAVAALQAKGSWRTHVFSAWSLKEKKFDPISYVVPMLIPEGLTVLAGRPKVGKSWMVLDIALAKAGGRFVLGDIHLTEGDVLYAALEDNDRRLRSRIEKILTQNAHTWPERLMLATRWRRLDAGGVTDAKEWAASVPNPRLIIFDTLAGVRPDRQNKDTMYEGDYRALAELQAWAGKAGLAIIRSASHPQTGFR